MYKNLNEYIARLDAASELQRIKCPVSTHLEIAEITERIAKSEGGGHALLFENTGTKFPVLTNLFGSDRRMAMALGTESLDLLEQRVDAFLRQTLAPKKTLWDKLRMLPMLGSASRWFPARGKGRGECQSVVYEGSEVNLDMLPILKCRIYDAERFVTLPMVHTLDPYTGAPNVGMYRMQVVDSRTTALHWHKHKTGARHYEGYRERGERMPVTVTLGGDPAYTYSATAPLPDNIDEYLLAGFLRKKPVKLVKSITNDIFIPADCDIVIEGYVDPSEAKFKEGPFADHTGFYSLSDLYPLFHITAITHRKDAIYPATIVGIPPQEDAYIARATERIFISPIRAMLQPEVCDMTMPEAGTAHNIGIFAIDKRYPGQAQKVAQGLWGAGQMMFNKYMLIVDKNCPVRSATALARVMRSISIPDALTFSEGVLDVLDHATPTTGCGSKLLIDATSIEVYSEKTLLHRQEFDELATSLGIAINTDFVEEWKALALFVPKQPYDIQPIVRAIAHIGEVKYIALFDDNARAISSGYELLWLCAANTDPRRDITSAAQCLYIDARSKCPTIEGNPSRFPNVTATDLATIELVDSRWHEYAIGDFSPSPSRRYAALMLTQNAEW